MKRTLIYAEQEYLNDAIDLLEAARQIYADESYESYALLINSDRETIEGLKGKFDAIVHVEDEWICADDQRSVSDILASLHREYRFDSILIPATPKGRMLAPRTAIQLKTGLVADITGIQHSEKGLELIRPAYSGRIMAGIVVTGDGPMMMTVRSGIFDYAADPPHAAPLVTREIPLDPKSLSYRSGGIKVLRREKKTVEYDIRESEVLISGGGGVLKSFKALEPLAEALGGQIAASRAVVDKGIVSRTIQVGQSGKTVSPRLYFALGIYGAVQHVAGLKDVDYIISVNINKNAPICSLSDIVVEGDAVPFINKLINKIKKEKKG